MRGAVVVAALHASTVDAVSELLAPAFAAINAPPIGESAQRERGGQGERGDGVLELR